MEGTGWSDIYLCISEISCRPSRLVWAYDYIALLELTATPNDPFKRYDLPPTAQLPRGTHPTSHYPPTRLPLIHAIHDITVMEKVQKIQQC